MNPIYLDYNATTPIDPRVVAAIPAGVGRDATDYAIQVKYAIKWSIYNPDFTRADKPAGIAGVVEAMLPWLCEGFGNPSSAHIYGHAAHQAASSPHEVARNARFPDSATLHPGYLLHSIPRTRRSAPVGRALYHLCRDCARRRSFERRLVYLNRTSSV